MAANKTFSAWALFVFLIASVSGRQLLQTGSGDNAMLETSCEMQGIFPYMASLRDDNGDHRCGATLIDRKAVLTSASCVDLLLHNDIGISEVYLGGYDPDLPVERRPVIAVFPHQRYTGDPRQGSDIAVVKFEGETCLEPIPSLGRRNSDGDFIVLGFGRTGAFDPLAEELLFSNESTIDIAECNAAGVDPPLEEGRLCSQSPNCTCASICAGDEGGPLLDVVDITEYTDVLVGVVSYSTAFCAEEGGYSVHTDVHHYREWIADTLESDDFVNA